MRILITDGASRSALAATRSLGKAGHEVLVASDKSPSLAGASRYAREALHCPSAQTAPAAFVEFIQRAIRDKHIELVLPMTDVSTNLIAANRALFELGCLVPTPPMDILAKAADKSYVLDAARRLGVPTPATIVLTQQPQPGALPAQVSYPVVIKPARSRVLAQGRWLSTSVTYAETAEHLQQKLAGFPSEVYPILLQERIDGPGVGVFACIHNGAPIALFSHRRLREKPPSGGVSVLCESTALDSAAVHYATALLSDLQWRGVAMVEFKRDVRDGSLRLMEINGRFWGSLQLSIDAGVDFPRLLVESMTTPSQDPQPPPAYRIGVRTRWFWGDVDSLLAVLTKDRRSLALPRNFPSRSQCVLAFMNFWRSQQRGEVMRFEDPAPGLLETWNWLLGRR